MTTNTETTKTINNLKNELAQDWTMESMEHVDGVLYIVWDMASDMAYVLTDNGELLVIDTDCGRVNTSDDMVRRGFLACNVPSHVEAGLGCEINDDWTISAA
jgi:hypothetical protein